MKDPYLVQRGFFHDNENKSGIDSILKFDYMGSSEFEFGAMPASLKRLRADIGEYVIQHYAIGPLPQKVVTFFCKKYDCVKAIEMLEKLAKGDIRTMERTDFDNWIYPKYKPTKEIEFWWDIHQDWMFWKKSEEFTAKFKVAIENKPETVK